MAVIRGPSATKFQTSGFRGRGSGNLQFLARMEEIKSREKMSKAEREAAEPYRAAMTRYQDAQTEALLDTSAEWATSAQVEARRRTAVLTAMGAESGAVKARAESKFYTKLLENEDLLIQFYTQSQMSKALRDELAVTRSGLDAARAQISLQGAQLAQQKFGVGRAAGQLQALREEKVWLKDTLGKDEYDKRVGEALDTYFREPTDRVTRPIQIRGRGVLNIDFEMAEELWRKGKVDDDAFWKVFSRELSSVGYRMAREPGEEKRKLYPPKGRFEELDEGPDKTKKKGKAPTITSTRDSTRIEIDLSDPEAVKALIEALKKDRFK